MPRHYERGSFDFHVLRKDRLGRFEKELQDAIAVFAPRHIWQLKLPYRHLNSAVCSVSRAVTAVVGGRGSVVRSRWCCVDVVRVYGTVCVACLK